MSPFQNSARSRWPYAKLEGDGRFALLSNCCQNKYVRLCHTAMEAATDKLESCGHAFCCVAHQVVELQPQQEYSTGATILRTPGSRED